MRLRFALVVSLALAGCASAPPPAVPVDTGPAPAVVVAQIRAAAGADREELAVQPLRDPMVEDLRREAAALEQKHLYRAAADALDRAIAVVPDDPALLQERAEAAVLLREYDQAEQLAQRAHELGAQVGPLCRRHWATIRAVRERRLGQAKAQPEPRRAEDAAQRSAGIERLAATVAEAGERFDACRVAPPPRY